MKRHSCRAPFACRLHGEALESRRLLAGHTFQSLDITPLEQRAVAAFDHASQENVRVSAGGRFYYLDHAQPAEPDDTEPVQAPTSADGVKIPLDELPRLNSNPDSENIFYLDFNGQVVTGTDWNETDNNGRDIHAVPYDLDGDLETFSEEEVAAITEIWQRVSEDFLPFDINITTVEPPADAFVGGRGAIRVIISTNVDDAAAGGTGDEWFKNAGGVAYIGSWLTPGDMPVWVFYNQLPDQVKSVAEAASHEFGHALGLSHDGGAGSAYYNGHGDGEAGWAPIMGAGYRKNVTQWSRGDYPGATNNEKDLNIITNVLNRIDYRTDDHGNWEPDATPLSRVGDQVLAAGVIEENVDLDFFSFEHPGGPLRLEVRPADIGPNLDVIAGLYDDERNELIVVEPDGALDAEIQIELDAGTYYLFVEGGGEVPDVGSGYDDYGSLGSYSITGYLGTPKLTAHPGGNAGSGCCQGVGCRVCLGDSYLIGEGEALVLDGSRSIVPSGEVVYEWDVDGDGQFDDATGAIASLTWDELGALSSPIRDDGAYSVALRVRAEDGTTDTQRTDLIVENRNPQVTLRPFDVDLVAGRAITFHVDVQDIAADPLVIGWNFGDGSEPLSGTETSVTHVFSEGTYDLTIDVADDDGGATVLEVPLEIEFDVPSIVSTSVVEPGSVIAPTSVSFGFTHDVSESLNPTDLYLFDSNDNVIVNPPEPHVEWLPDSQEAVFSVEGVPAGDYLLVLNGGGIFDRLDVHVDADGNGTPGGNWSLAVTVADAGDANLDGNVDFEDFIVLSTLFGESATGWEEADFDHDGRVTFSDFIILSSNYLA